MIFNRSSAFFFSCRTDSGSPKDSRKSIRCSNVVGRKRESDANSGWSEGKSLLSADRLSFRNRRVVAILDSGSDSAASEIMDSAHSKPEYFAQVAHLAYIAKFYDNPAMLPDIRNPDHPWSLYEGMAGMCCAWAEMLCRIETRSPRRNKSGFQLMVYYMFNVKPDLFLTLSVFQGFNSMRVYERFAHPRNRSVIQKKNYRIRSVEHSS